MDEDNKVSPKSHTTGSSGIMLGRVAEVALGLGIPMGSGYAYRFQSGREIVLHLTAEGVRFESRGDSYDELCTFIVWALWIVSWVGCAHDVGKFSAQMSEAEAHQVIDFLKKLEDPAYANLSTDELVQKVREQIFVFWRSFIRGEATEIQ